MIAAFDNLFKKVVLGANKRWVASQEDEQHHTTAPHVHWFTVGLPLHHLRGHVLRRTDTTWNDCVMFTWTVEELETQDFPLYLYLSLALYRANWWSYIIYNLNYLSKLTKKFSLNCKIYKYTILKKLSIGVMVYT